MLDANLTANILAGCQRIIKPAPNGFHYSPDVINPFGGKPKPPRKGAKGVAGVRADLRDGVLTIHDIARMRVCDLAVKYRVNRRHAGRIKKMLMMHGPNAVVVYRT